MRFQTVEKRANGKVLGLLVFGIVVAFVGSMSFGFSRPRKYDYAITKPLAMEWWEGDYKARSAHPVIVKAGDKTYRLTGSTLTRDGLPADFSEIKGHVAFYSDYTGPELHYVTIYGRPPDELLLGRLSLVGLPVMLGLFGWFVYRGKAYVKLQPHERGIVLGSNKLLHPGMNHIGLTAQAVATTTVPVPATTTVQQAMSQDGAQFTVTVSYLIQPSEVGFDKVFAFKDSLTGQVEKKVQAAIRRQMKKFPTWYDAAHGDEELQNALTEDFTGAEGDMVLNTYGVHVTDFTVNDIKPIGELEKMSLMGLSKEKASAKKGFRAMADAIKELEEMRGKLLEAGLREDEVKRIIEKRRLEILDDE